MFRIRERFGNFLNARANGIERSCQRKHFAPYGSTKAIIETFRVAAKNLLKYSDGIIKTDKTNPVKDWKEPLEQTKDAAKVVLEHISLLLPKIYKPMQSLLAMEYPELCGISRAPKKL